MSAFQASFFSVILTIVFYFYFQSLQPYLNQLLQRRRFNLLRVFNDFSRELVYLKDLRDLLQSTARMLRRELFIWQISIYLLDEKKKEFFPAIAKGVRALGSFSQKDLFLEWLEKHDGIATEKIKAGGMSAETIKKEAADYFEETHASVVVPLVLGGKLIGMINLGRKSNLSKYSFNEIQFLSQVRSPLTIAFSNSMRFENIHTLSEELRRWNQELEQRVDQRTRELAITQEQLVQAEKLATLGTLAGGVAHEINNPLTAVLTNAQILRMSASPETVDSLNMIEEGAKRCQQIVQKLMKYARKPVEEAPFYPVDLNEVIRNVVNLIGFQLEQEGIKIELELGTVPKVPGISNELEQVFTNLLINAKDAIRDARRKRKVVVRTVYEDGVVVATVRDNGIGIKKEDLTKIFDPFFTTKDVGFGTGLGLSVSFGILKRHNATIRAESEVGQGTTFILRFQSTLTPGPRS